MDRKQLLWIYKNILNIKYTFVEENTNGYRLGVRCVFGKIDKVLTTEISTEHECSLYKNIVNTLIFKYYLLKNGDVITDGDECLGLDGLWRDVINFKGHIFNDKKFVSHRRIIH